MDSFLCEYERRTEKAAGRFDSELDRLELAALGWAS